MQTESGNEYGCGLSDGAGRSAFPRTPVSLCFLVVVLLLCPGKAADIASVASADGEQQMRSGSDAVLCANLIYAETRSSVCFSEMFLASVAQDSTISVARRFRPVKLASNELFAYPFAVMTGEGDFTLTTQERARLKGYLEGGGFLLASAGCSSTSWDASFRREIAQVFPGQTLRPLTVEHPIFRTIYDIDNLKTKSNEATLYGLDIGGKTVLIYSPDGLNDTGSMYGCCCCGGNEIANSRKINANILAYALMQ